MPILPNIDIERTNTNSDSYFRSTPPMPAYSKDKHDIQASYGNGSNNDDAVDVKWQETLDKVAAAVVSVKFCHTRAFDAEKAASSEATGFVVDADRGYVLSFYHDHLRAYLFIDTSSRTDT